MPDGVNIYFLPLFYLFIISLITFIVTCYDKFSAKKGRRRVSEKALIILAVLGGSISEYFTMKLIRHKTLHKKFMIGLPVIMIFQLCFILLILYYSG